MAIRIMAVMDLGTVSIRTEAVNYGKTDSTVFKALAPTDKGPLKCELTYHCR
jgi:hypothetical protein